MQLNEPPAATSLNATGAPQPRATLKTDAGPASSADLSMAACGPKLARALERAAVRDLKASRRDVYRAQDDEDRELIERLRLERNSTVERLNEQAREIDVTRELDLSAQRAAWVDANDVAAVKRREARAAVKEARKHDTPLRRAYLEELRHDHNARIEQLDEELHALRVAHGLAEAELRAPWLDAKERTRVAKRTMQAALRELRAQEKVERPQRIAGEDAARRERNEASDKRWEAARKATTEHAVMQVEIREARQAGTGDLTALRAHEAELRAQAAQLEKEAREGDLAAANKAFEQCHVSSVNRAVARADLRAEWLAARHEADIERRRSRDAVRAFRESTKREMSEADARIRALRNAENESYEQAVNEVYLTWGLSEAELRSESLDARAYAHELKLAAREANRAYLQQGREEEAAQLEDIRQKRNAAYESYAQEVLDIRTKRGVARAEERECARTTALTVYARYRAELAGA